MLNAHQVATEAEIVAQAGQRRQGDRRHEHGRPRHRHQPRRQCSGDGLGQAARQIPGPPGGSAGGMASGHGGNRAGRETLRRAGQGSRAGRPARHLHRVARLGPHRPPAHGPLRPARRPRHRAAVHVARRRRASDRLRPRNGRQDGTPWPASPRQCPAVSEPAQAAQRKVERRHLRDRFVLLYHENERKKMQAEMGQDPYLDTPD